MAKHSSEHIHPIFGQILGRKEKENLLGQNGGVYWLTGLSGSGKSTIAREVEKSLHQKGFLLKLLDGDNIRSGINADLGFSVEARQENIRRISEIAKLFVDTGIITLVSFISPTVAIRKMARSIIGEADFNEVYIQADLSICEQRDVKGLYKKARAGVIKDFTGIDSPYEAPLQPALVLNSGSDSLESCTQQMVEFILNKQVGTN